MKNRHRSQNLLISIFVVTLSKKFVGVHLEIMTVLSQLIVISPILERISNYIVAINTR